MIKNIKFLLKEKGLTINGVKKLLKDKKTESIDDYKNLSVYNPRYKTTNMIKDKIKNISKIVKEIKNLKNG